MAQPKPMMTFVDAVKQCLRKYGDFSDRATRAEFWWWQVFAWIGSSIFGAVDSSIASFTGGDGFSPFAWIFGLATLLPGLAVGARRLHDIGKTGWWILVWAAIIILGLIPFAVGLAFAGVNGLFDGQWDKTTVSPLLLGLLVSLLVWLVVVVWWVAWMTRQGEAGPNRYGPDPRALDESGPAGADVIG